MTLNQTALTTKLARTLVRARGQLISKRTKFFVRISALAFKGQIISECLFDVFKFSKKPTKNLTNFCPETKKWSNQQNKGTFL